MLYPVYIHAGDEQHAHGITVPDFPGCFSAADHWDDIPAKVQEAIELYCEDEDMDLPAPTSLDRLIGNADHQGGTWMVVDIDTTRLATKPTRINVSLPRALVPQMDRYAKAHGMTRSGLIASAVRRVMADTPS